MSANVTGCAVFYLSQLGYILWTVDWKITKND